MNTTKSQVADSKRDGLLSTHSRPDTALAEADYIGASFAGQVGQKPWVLIDAPSGREGYVNHTPSAKGSGNAKLSRCRLRPYDLVEGKSAVFGSPEVRIRAGEN
jgi:hypothetical protein